ncbi:hypothetical protein NDU88_001258 [Pleurodeles waltl]|uniref:Uncharacterized protein n=1 Tax=Pleurodeles waltl TaxID=8319 RepID=A0AAV7SZH9_PLEWA|nr:hypothetical protein NDU88_001258 [Pleurodeles waltl]
MVGDTIPHVNQSSRVRDKVAEALSRRRSQNDQVSKKLRAKRREVQVGDVVLVRNRRVGSKFLLPFEKDLEAIKGTMVRAHKGQESITRSISFFKLFRLPNPNTRGMDGSQPGSLDANDDESTADHPDGVPTSPRHSMDGTNSQHTTRAESELLNSLDYWLEDL